MRDNPTTARTERPHVEDGDGSAVVGVKAVNDSMITHHGHVFQRSGCLFLR